MQSIAEIVKMIGENLELIEVVSANFDNIDYGEMIWVDDGTEEGIKTFTVRGIEYLKELLADIRTWNGGTLGFLRDEKCESDLIERIMTDEMNRQVQTALAVGLRPRCRRHHSALQERQSLKARRGGAQPGPARIETKMHCLKLLDQHLAARDFDVQVAEL